MSYIEHAKREFAGLGWPGDCEMQSMVCKNVLELLETLSSQGHSGSSAPYVLNLFGKLARFDPIGPLTGADSEWMDVGDGLEQNIRDSSVFREDGQAYWMYGKIFREPDGVTYTSSDSRINIEFPWTKPESEIVDVPKPESAA